LLSKLKRMKEQITEQKKEMAIAKAQITRMKREKTEIEEGNEVLRTALAVKTFEQSELQNKLKEKDRQRDEQVTELLYRID
jgi:regulator of replication initiation timing